MLKRTSKKTQSISKNNLVHFIFYKILTPVLFVSAFCFAKADSSSNDANDSKLVDEYVKSKGYTGVISFDSSNIKQFWIDTSVISQNSIIDLYLNKKNAGGANKSVPFNIQLANVVETQDCLVEIVSETPDFSFSIFNSEEKEISVSKNDNDFIQYHVSSALVHLEDTKEFSFKIVFSSDKTDNLKIQKIILSFSENKESHYLGSPGFESLLKEFETKGISLPDQDIQYFLSKEINKLFIKTTNQLADSYRFFYHGVPVDKKMITKEGFSFNNIGEQLNWEYARIPKTPFSKSDYTIIQLPLPSYPCSKITFGQYESTKQIWKVELTQQ